MHLVSGNVNEVTYQKGSKDQFIHRYEYDSDNRITIVETSKDGFVYEKDAKYFYYDHGPLARTELGDKKVQAEDYAYTIQGWLKTVNGEQIDETTMLGQDSKTATINSQVAKDAFGYSLSYFDGDFTSASSAMLNYSPTSNNLGTSIYNGNIRSMFTAMSKTDESLLETHQTVYGYDQLNRLLSMDGFNRTPNEGSTIVASDYKSRYSYDANGNLQTMQNWANNGTAAVQMDNFVYNYTPSNNRLISVDDDALLSANYTVDVDDQGTNNYSYDQIGQLIGDVAENIQEIKWTVSNKVKEVIYNNALTGKRIVFDYDAMGHRIAKHSTTTNNETTSTFYVLDAQGNPMSTYEFETFGNTANKLYLSERNIYGSKRVGIEQPYLVEMILESAHPAPQLVYDNQIGDKRYELSNHLGNVLNVVTDRKLPMESTTVSGLVGYYTSDVVSYSDYMPFGQVMPNRHGSVGTKYRYGFQDQEMDDELKGEGNSVNFEYRMHDPRIGRFFAVDPLIKKYPFYSPYAFSGNEVIGSREIEGLEPGKLFDSRGAAAINWAMHYNDKSIRENKEYASAIYLVKTEKGIKYAYTKPNIGTAHESEVPDSPKGEVISADIHSHGAYEGYANEDDFSNKDIINLDALSRVGFLANDRGSLTKYDPKTEKFSVISQDIPHDKNTDIPYNKTEVNSDHDNIISVGHITFDSDKARKMEGGKYFIVKDLKTKKDYGVTRNTDGSYKFLETKKKK